LLQPPKRSTARNCCLVPYRFERRWYSYDHVNSTIRGEVSFQIDESQLWPKMESLPMTFRLLLNERPLYPVNIVHSARHPCLCLPSWCYTP
jgi:hypothetical protein